MPNPLNEPIGLLGGTFDPLHAGHIEMIEKSLQHFPLHEMRLIPCKYPVHKPQAQALTDDRIAMLNLVIENHPHWLLDTCEIDRDTPSYMIDTLRDLEKALPNTPLCLVMGSDALQTFDTWDHWENIIEHAHLIVIQRSGYPYPKTGVICDFINQHLTTDRHKITVNRAGHVFLEDFKIPDLSSTEIRERAQAGQSIQDFVPPKVWEYIQAEHLYTQSP